MILLAYRHGLRAAELVDLPWDQIDFNQAVLHVRRVKKGTPSMHPLTGRELRALQTDAIDISPGRLADPLTKPTKFRLRQEARKRT
jgi:integrase